MVKRKEIAVVSNNSKTLGFAEAYRAFRKSVDLVELDIDPAEVFGKVRDDRGEEGVGSSAGGAGPVSDPGARP